MSEPTSEPPGLRVAFGPVAFRAILGQYDANLRLIERTFGVRLVARDGEVLVAGDAVPAAACARFLEQLSRLVDSGHAMSAQDVAAAARLTREAPDTPLAEHFLRGGVRGPGRRLVTPRTARQSEYLDAIRQHELVFAVGPAGTGKTYLAVAMAAEALALRQVRRLVLVRPAVEAGERLGFLPGDLAQKVDPYLRPLYDALFDILDEAQNTTPEQMKMFLTRIGEGSKVVVTGDVTQIDLGPGRLSGLVNARDVVAGIEGVVFIDFDKRDVVRHALVQRIVHAYELFGERSDEAGNDRRNGGGR